MREILVTELVKEVLGPRNGIDEILTESPLSEYITGVLAPIVPEAEPDIDGEAMIPNQESQTIQEVEATDVEVDAPTLLSPALNPKSRPCSMGISFVLESNGQTAIEICLTWARYSMIEENNGMRWHRRVRHFILETMLDRDIIVWLGDDGIETEENEAEASLHIIRRQTNENRLLVNCYFVNRVDVPSNAYPTAEHHIFQPQIRIVGGEETRVVPGSEPLNESEGENELSFLYRKRQKLARGYLCSAVWKDVDPESGYAGPIDFPSCNDLPPFAWTDKDCLPPDQQERFTCPDVRSEFVPMYEIPSGDLQWPQDYGECPELRADVLAESFDPEDLRGKLDPILNGYENWLDELREEAGEYTEPERDIAENLIGGCERMLTRLRHAIDLLENDNDVRLAFCLSQKAMNLQSIWTRQESLEWRPFQLTFMLLNLESIADEDSEDRSICDLLWIPTGGGKTEAYLAIATFAMAYRRRRSLQRNCGNRTGAGVSVITRYTLRLLTIQQFRRATAAMTALEFLRVRNLSTGYPVGWRPVDCGIEDSFIWGTVPFSIGLWVGGGVTPNKLQDTWGGNRTVPGGLSLLRGQQGQGEPAQILECPACGGTLAIPNKGLRRGNHNLHLVLHSENPKEISQITPGVHGDIEITSLRITPHTEPRYFTLSMEISVRGTSTARDVDDMWNGIADNLEHVTLTPVRASRPGYFIRYFQKPRGGRKDFDFDILCANPECPLQEPWCAGAPAGSPHSRGPFLINREQSTPSIPAFPDGNRYVDIQTAFRVSSTFLSDRIPILAYTVDDQIYMRAPSMVISTVDKYARPPFEPRTSSLFGNVDHCHSAYGYYRPHQHSSSFSSGGHPGPAGRSGSRNFVQIESLDPPDMILQDELHLIEGPLGSLVGIYESAIDFLCREGRESCPKYVASTATIRRAEEHVKAIFARELQTFPPSGTDIDDRFFVREFETHALDDGRPGRLYAGVCALGRGPLTPLIRIWSRLLQTAWENRTQPMVDGFWTLTGYFNAIRELAGARALYRQDIPQRLNEIAPGNARPLPDESSQELSSRTDSTDLPAVLDLLNVSLPQAQDSLLTTSMFGTGVDVSRIALMVVNGQPKTTSSYIQSTGRVGRRRGALVVTFLRGSRPRDLNHYELFCGYHRQIQRFVEPATVYPFAPGVLERACGPVSVFALRTMMVPSVPWHEDISAPLMANQRDGSSELAQISQWLESRSQNQPPTRRPPSGSVRQYSDSEIDRWQQIAGREQNLRYKDYSTPPRHPVVLGDPAHQHMGIPVVYRNAPTSLRDVEETTGFQT
ncbi:MAG: DISARM system helicase DrmA [Candidatus Thorarchaeota archaeon]